MSAPLDVLVAGGGAAATAAALAAAAAGLRVQQVQADAAPVRGRRYALSARSINFLRRLDACPPLLPVAGFHLHAGGRWHAIAGKRPLCAIAEEAALAQALAAAAKRRALHPRQVADLRWQHTDDAAAHLSADGAPVRARLLAVADGMASPLAAQLGIGAAAAEMRQRAWVGQAAAPALRADAAYQWFGEQDTLALLPAGSGEFSMIWSRRQAETAPDSAALAAHTGLADIALCGEVRAFPLRAQVRAARVAPRTALLGDAAGVLHPLAGQGLNLGLADADTLLQCTQRRLGRHIALGLAAYSHSRSRRQQQMQALTRLFSRARPAAALLALGRIPPLKHAAIAFANEAICG